MGFQNVVHEISLTREQLIALLVDNARVEIVTRNGERMTLMGSGTHTKDGLGHAFFTSIDYKDSYLWVTVVLYAPEDGIYTGKLTYEIYHDKMSE